MKNLIIKYLNITVIIGIFILPINVSAQNLSFLNSNSANNNQNSQFYNTYQNELLKYTIKNNLNNSSSSLSSISIVDYLKNYIGQSILITNSNKRVIAKEMVKEVIIGEKGYYFLINDDIKIKVVFEGYQRTKTYVEQKNSQYKNLSQKDTVLRNRMIMQQQLAMVANSIYSSGSTGVNSMSPITIPDKQSDNSQGDLIEYYDVATKTNKSGMANIINNKLYLKDGTPITLRFLKEEV